jgi:quercetin dioxygenase-like cupin family protein
MQEERETGVLKTSLEALGRELLEEARRSSAHRAARTVVGGHERTMRQTLLALVEDAELEEHENPGEASLFVVSGRLVLRAGSDSWDGRAGDLIEIPQTRHSVAAHGDAVFLLTAVPQQRATATS